MTQRRALQTSRSNTSESKRVFGSCWEHHRCSISPSALRPGKLGTSPCSALSGHELDQQHGQPNETHVSPLPLLAGSLLLWVTSSSNSLSKHTCTRLVNHLLLSLKRENLRTSSERRLYLLLVFNSFSQINPFSSTRD